MKFTIFMLCSILLLAFVVDARRGRGRGRSKSRVIYQLNFQLICFVEFGFENHLQVWDIRFGSRSEAHFLWWNCEWKVSLNFQMQIGLPITGKYRDPESDQYYNNNNVSVRLTAWALWLIGFHSKGCQDNASVPLWFWIRAGPQDRVLVCG